MINFGQKFSAPELVARILLISGVVCLELQPTQKQPTAAGNPFHLEPPQILLIQHVESRTSSITISWRSAFNCNSYQVRARSLLSGITLTGQPTNETEYRITDLMIETRYNICVTADVTRAQFTGSEGEDHGVKATVETCLELSTIPLLRVDSVLVLLGVVAFVVLSIAAALVCWKCGRKDDAATSTTEATTSDYKDNANGMESGVLETDIRKNSDEAQPLLGDENSDKVKSQPEIQFASGTQPPNDLQSNELFGQQTSV